jgi:hypothetical protein
MCQRWRRRAPSLRRSRNLPRGQWLTPPHRCRRAANPSVDARIPELERIAHVRSEGRRFAHRQKAEASGNERRDDGQRSNSEKGRRFLHLTALKWLDLTLRSDLYWRATPLTVNPPVDDTSTGSPAGVMRYVLFGFGQLFSGGPSVVVDVAAPSVYPIMLNPVI